MSFAQRARKALRDLAEVGDSTTIKGPLNKHERILLGNALRNEALKDGKRVVCRYEDNEMVIHRIDGRV